MTICSNCYWAEQCGCLTTTCCSDYTPLTGEDPAEEAYLATVRAEYTKHDLTKPDDEIVGSVYNKLRDSTQYLFL